MSDGRKNKAWAELYHPVEHKILSEYLGLPAPVPVGEVDIREKSAQEQDHICVERNFYGEYSEISLENAVARICLNPIQRRLPQWAAFDPNGGVVLGRAIRPRPDRPVVALPQHLFTINWADTAPGISWPEAYHLTLVPGYQHHIVTASQDSPEATGYTEQAIGHFLGGGEGVVESAGEVIKDYWHAMIDYQDPWEMFWEAGLVDEDRAAAWALDAWELRTALNGDMPGWYKDKLLSKKRKGLPEDQRRLSRFKRLIDAGTPFDELPDDLRRWWVNRY